MYKNHRSGEFVIRISDLACIPKDPRNNDYAEVLEWVAAGNVIAPADPPSEPTQDEIDSEAARQYAKLAALRTMTPAQVAAWVEQNVTDFASAKDVLKTLAVFACVASRRI